MTSRLSMTRTARALHRLCMGRPCRVIRSGGEPYLVRVYLAHWGGWRLYLHRFVTPDGERWLHDHPFDGGSLILSGGYIEEVLPALGAEVRGFRRRWWNWIPARKFHRISSVQPNTWTMFVHGPHRKQWGFLEPWGFLERFGFLGQLENGGAEPLMYYNPFGQQDSAGAHWWAEPGVSIYPPDGVR